MSDIPGGYRHLSVYAATVRRVLVHPSDVVLQTDQGDEFMLDVGTLYALFAAHLYQNSFWRDVDFEELSADLQAKFAIGSRSAGYGRITALRFRWGTQP